MREETLLGLEAEQQRYIVTGLALSFDFAFKGRYLYMSARQRGFGRCGEVSTVPLCRLRYEGRPDRWRFEIYRYSRNAYDEEHDFPFSGGSPPECLAVAADFYLLEYDVLEAGSSRARGVGTSQANLQGEAGLLPPLPAPGPVELPADFPEGAGTWGRPLLADLDAFLGFVAGRAFDLTPKTLGFRRQTLIEVNGRMGQPAPLHSRPVQSDAPRVQCCFAVAEALGMLHVVKACRHAEATPEVARFQAMAAPERLWAVLEAMWQRVHWAALRPRAFGNMDAYQAGRYWLGAELARREEALTFDWRLTAEAEVLEVFVLPFWRDAGLLALEHDRTMAVDRFCEKRTTRLRRVEPTGTGRRVFGHLSAISPAHERLGAMAHRADGRWNGWELLAQIAAAGTMLHWPPGDSPDGAHPEDE